MISNKDKYKECFNICQQLSGNNGFNFHIGIDHIEGIMYLSNDTVINIINNIKFNESIKGHFKSKLTRKSKYICILTNYPDVKIELHDDIVSSIVFSFTSKFLRYHSNDDTIRAIHEFFQIIGLDYGEEYIISHLKIHYAECFVDIFSCTGINKSLVKLVDLVATTHTGGNNGKLPQIRAKRMLNKPKLSDKSFTSHRGIKLKNDTIIKENDYFEIEQSFMDKRSKFHIYNKMLHMTDDPISCRHWWHHYKNYFQFPDDDFKVFKEHMGILTPSYRDKIYYKLKSFGFSIFRFEYKLESTFLHDCIDKSENENSIHFKSFFTCLNNPVHLFLFCMDIFDIEVIGNEGKWIQHPLFSLVKTELLNNNTIQFNPGPIDEEDEKLLECKKNRTTGRRSRQALSNSIYFSIANEEDKDKLKEYMNEMKEFLKPVMAMIELYS